MSFYVRDIVTDTSSSGEENVTHLFHLLNTSLHSCVILGGKGKSKSGFLSSIEWFQVRECSVGVPGLVKSSEYRLEAEAIVQLSCFITSPVIKVNGVS